MRFHLTKPKITSIRNYVYVFPRTLGLFAAENRKLSMSMYLAICLSVARPTTLGCSVLRVLLDGIKTLAHFVSAIAVTGSLLLCQ